jgi:hypothetical protein
VPVHPLQRVLDAVEQVAQPAHTHTHTPPCSFVGNCGEAAAPPSPLCVEKRSPYRPSPWTPFRSERGDESIVAHDLLSYRACAACPRERLGALTAALAGCWWAP